MVTNGDVYLKPDEIQRLEEAYLGGKKAGQREVIEWLDEPCPHIKTTSETPIYRWGCRKCWQAKLKEVNDGSN